MIEQQKEQKATLKPRVKFHSYAKMHFCSQPLPIFQGYDAPYDFYVKFQFKGSLEQLQPYQYLSRLGSIVTPIMSFEVDNPETSWLSRLWGEKAKQPPKMSIYLKYYNHTLADWMRLIKDQGGVVPEEEIISILSSLLSLADAYHELYCQPAKIFSSAKILFTPARTLQIYPIQFQLPPMAVKTLQTAPSNKRQIYKKESRKYSHQVTLQSSRVIEMYSQHSIQVHDRIDEDLRDIFLIVMELLTFHDYSYFFSPKHQMIKWDLVKQFTRSSEFVSHLSRQLLNALKDVIEGRIQTCRQLLERLDLNQQRKWQNKHLSLSINDELVMKRENTREKVYREKRTFLSRPFALLKRK